MVDTALLLSVTSAGSLFRAGVASLLNSLGEKANQAQQEYQRASLAIPDDPLEQRRLECLQKLSEIRNRSTLYGGERDLQQRVLCLVMEQTINAYEAQNLRSLDLVIVDLEQIEAVLDAEEENRRHQRTTRRVAVGVSLLFLLLIGAAVTFAGWINFDGQRAMPFLGIPPCVILWSALGSFAAILYRFTNAGDNELEDPLRWLFSRPITGIIMGAIAYLVLKAGLLVIAQSPGVIQGASGAAEHTNELMWLIAFIAGFSDRFSEGTLRSLIGKFGGNRADELVSMEVSPSRNRSLDLLPKLRAKKEKAAPNGTPGETAVLEEAKGIAASTVSGG